MQYTSRPWRISKHQRTASTNQQHTLHHYKQKRIEWLYRSSSRITQNQTSLQRHSPTWPFRPYFDVKRSNRPLRQRQRSTESPCFACCAAHALGMSETSPPNVHIVYFCQCAIMFTPLRAHLKHPAQTLSRLRHSKCCLVLLTELFAPTSAINSGLYIVWSLSSEMLLLHSKWLWGVGWI